MSAWRICVLITWCSLQRLQGEMQLPPPQNVTLLSKDFDIILTWLPGEGFPPDVVYMVKYRSWGNRNHLKTVAHCQNISETICNLTCVLSDPFTKYRARVKALSAGRQSSWAESGYIEHHFDVELAPPVLGVKVRENLMTVNATFPLASCLKNEFQTLQYDLEFWEAGSNDKKQYKGKTMLQNVEINTTAFSGNFCLSARTSFQVIDLKHSEFSRPVCVPLNPKGVDWKLLLVIVVPLFLLLLARGFLNCLCKELAKSVKTPQVLDFSCPRPLPLVLEKKPNEEEFFVEELLISMLKLELQKRRNNPSARNNISPAASLLSLSEEEEDDSGFTPYIEKPWFPKRGPNCQVSGVSQKGLELSSESGVSQPDGGSVPNLAGCGFSRRDWRETEEDTSGFQDSEKTSLSDCSSLGHSRRPTDRYEQRNVDVDRCQQEVFLQVTVPTEGLRFNPFSEDPHLPARGHFDPDPERLPFPEHIASLKVRVSEDSSELPPQDVILQTLQFAEDEDISSDCDSETDFLAMHPAGGTPPPATMLRETFEAGTWGKYGTVEEKNYQKLKFQGYQQVNYISRN
ncbi:interferon lambda receptor 1 [Alligator mississippiensis]|uniref:Interferon lambda receptor 1 n=2 Tax=Alligator mississippiensis TaxID=8496 RepID=A0A151MMM1_ALLMI|nr:interferon lambda receptor 1 [Alligator mississippiensis]